MEDVKQVIVDLPGGSWTFLVDGDVLVASLFGAHPDEAPPLLLDHPIARALLAYSDGDVHAIDSIPVSQHEGPFHAKVRAAMRQIPPGETASYSELAAEAGNPLAARAAASACSRNQIGIVIPCHRVVRNDGSLGGYEFGLDVKRALLAFERDAR